MGIGSRAVGAVSLVGCLLIAAPQAGAFCGFYVAGADEALYNDATMVVLVREGTHTVLSMRNDYRGPPQDFAMVVPVPEVLEEHDVRTLDDDVFDRVERLAAPRLVEYWEQDPCAPELPEGGMIGLGNLGTIGFGAGGSGYGRGGGYQVTIEAEFTVGEYEIVILGARDSNGLERWLRDHGYRIPEGASESLRPYVEAGTKFFVAKVDVDRVHFEDGRAELSPLRIHYESDDFALPVRLGMLNSSGTQDLLVHILATQRYEVANYENVTVPTNLDLKNEVRDRFAETYAAIFDRTLEQHPGAVVTEYAWPANNCDPCPGNSGGLSSQDTVTLGVGISAESPSAGSPAGSAFWASRVRAPLPEVRGSLAAEVIRRITRRHINEVRFCHERAMQGRTSDAAAAAPTVRFTIGETGAVTHAELASPPSVAALDQCVVNAHRRWTFPAPDGGGTVDVTQRYQLSAEAGRPGRRPGFGGFGGPGVVLTRLHYRYTEEGLKEDLVFREASPIIGGREVREEGELSQGASPSPQNQFQARYAIRHEWTGPIECEEPVRGRWGGPVETPGAEAPPERATQPAMNLARAPRGQLALTQALAVTVPALGVGEVAAAEAEAADPPGDDEPAADTPQADVLPEREEGCGCQAGPAGFAPLAFALFALASRRRRFSGRG